MIQDRVTLLKNFVIEVAKGLIKGIYFLSQAKKVALSNLSKGSEDLRPCHLAMPALNR